jgi:hypothetical protein
VACLLFGRKDWLRCQEEGGLKRLSVEGFSGFILFQLNQEKRYDVGMSWAFTPEPNNW